MANISCHDFNKIYLTESWKDLAKSWQVLAELWQDLVEIMTRSCQSHGKILARS